MSSRQKSRDINEIIQKHRKQLDTLLEEYKKSYNMVRLEHDVYHMKMTRNSLGGKETERLNKIKTIERTIHFLFVEMLYDAGIGISGSKGRKAVENVEKSKHNTHAFKVSMGNEGDSIVENAALEREKILQFRVMREKVFFGLFIICVGVGVYVIFRDMKEVEGGGGGGGGNSGKNKGQEKVKKSGFNLPAPPMPKNKTDTSTETKTKPKIESVGDGGVDKGNESSSSSEGPSDIKTTDKGPSNEGNQPVLTT